MTITEVAILEALPPYTINSEEIQTFFQKVDRLQSNWSGHPLYYFYPVSSVEESSPSSNLVYLISGWKDVPAHYEWIKSDDNQGLLKEANEAQLIGVKGLLHLDIDFEEMRKLGLEQEEALVYGKDEVVEKDKDLLEKAKWYKAGKDFEKSEEEAKHYLIAVKEADLDVGKLKVAGLEVLKRARWTTDND